VNDIIDFHRWTHAIAPHAAGDNLVRVYITTPTENHSPWILRQGSWSISKRLTAETFDFTHWSDQYGQAAWRPPENAPIIAWHGTDLLFGGTIKSINEYRLGGEGPIAHDVNCRGYEEIPEKIVLTGTYVGGPVRSVIYPIWQTYLAPKGVTWIGPTSGGPVVGDTSFVRSKLSDILTEISKKANATWRINGEKWFGVMLPGDLPLAPVNGQMTADHFLKGTVRIARKMYEYANRLILQSGGTGEANHTESHVADGIKTTFLLNVEPKLATKKTENEIDTWTYYFPTKVDVGGTEHNLDGSTGWMYNSEEHGVFTSGAPPAAGTVIKVLEYKIGFPATVRVWLPHVLLPDGFWNYAVVEDKLLNVSHIADVDQVKAWGDQELSRRAVTPRTLSGSTRLRGFYPLMSGMLYIPEMFVAEDFLLQNVSITDEGLDTTHHYESLTYALEFIEGGVVGRQYETLFKEFLAGGASGGGSSISGSGGSVENPGGGGGGGTSGATPLPSGFTFHLGGDNQLAANLTTAFQDIPQMIPMRFGGAGMQGAWSLKAFGYRIIGAQGAGFLEVALFHEFAGQIATAVIDADGNMTQGPWGYDDYQLACPAQVGNMTARCRMSGGPGMATIGHCVLVKN
jgi:hypothetical protein